MAASCSIRKPVGQRRADSTRLPLGGSSHVRPGLPRDPCCPEAVADGAVAGLEIVAPSVSERNSASHDVVLALLPTSISHAEVEDRFRSRIAKRDCEASQVYTQLLCARSRSADGWAGVSRLHSMHQYWSDRSGREPVG